MADFRTGKKIWKLNLEYPVPGKKECSKTKHNDEEWQIDAETNQNNSQLSKLEKFKQRNKVVLNYKPNCKINICVNPYLHK